MISLPAVLPVFPLVSSFFIKKQFGICPAVFVCGHKKKVRIAENSELASFVKLGFQRVPKIGCINIYKVTQKCLVYAIIMTFLVRELFHESRKYDENDPPYE